ncbi:MAG TPA: LacI family DNA-binding transcriptional regulator [Paracoccaceae bacterium]
MKRKGPANLTQIAHELGLSVTTVSRALKDGAEVHPDTTARVKETAARLGYLPNLAGRALRTGRSNNLTAILPLETSGSLSDLAKLPLIEGMTLAAQQRGYALSIASTIREEDPRAGLLRVLHSGSTDGVIITRMLSGDPRPAFLSERGFPFVSFGRSDAGIAHAYVDVENEVIAEDATRRLVAAGCRRIALQLLVPDDHVSAMRLLGHRRALGEAGLDPDPDLLGHSDYTIAASEAWVSRLLDLPSPPDGLICANELGLFGALGALRAHGLLAGRDLQIIVRDSTGLCRHVLSDIGVHFVNLTAVGEQLVQALIAQIETPTKPPLRALVGAAFEQVGLCATS